MRRLTEIVARVGRALPNSVWAVLARFQHRGALSRRLVEALTRPLRHRDVRIVAGRLKGTKINLGGSYLRYLTGDVEPEVQQSLVDHVRPGDVVYDIGANIGFFAILCSRLVGEAGKVYAFEPMPENAATLRHNIALNQLTNVVVIEKAVSSDTGTAELFISPWSAAHSLNVEGAAKRDNRGPEAREPIVVATVALDDLVAQDELDAPDFVKLDVEGAEVQALEGMREIMTSTRPLLMCELHGPQPGYGDFIRSIEYETQLLDRDSPKFNPDNAHTLARSLDRSSAQTASG